MSRPMRGAGRTRGFPGTAGGGRLPRQRGWRGSKTGWYPVLPPPAHCSPSPASRRRLQTLSSRNDEDRANRREPQAEAGDRLAFRVGRRRPDLGGQGLHRSPVRDPTPRGRSPLAGRRERPRPGRRSWRRTRRPVPRGPGGCRRGCRPGSGPSSPIATSGTGIASARAARRAPGGRAGEEPGLAAGGAREAGDRGLEDRSAAAEEIDLRDRRAVGGDRLDEETHADRGALGERHRTCSRPISGPATMSDPARSIPATGGGGARTRSKGSRMRAPSIVRGSSERHLEPLVSLRPVGGVPAGERVPVDGELGTVAAARPTRSRPRPGIRAPGRAGRRRTGGGPRRPTSASFPGSDGARGQPRRRDHGAARLEELLDLPRGSRGRSLASRAARSRARSRGSARCGGRAGPRRHRTSRRASPGGPR